MRHRIVYAAVMGVLIASCMVRAGEIHDAVESRDVARVRQLLDGKPEIVNAKTRGGSTPIHLAVGMNHAGLTKLLIERGADINAGTGKGYTPLHWAAIMNADLSAEMLVAAGADPTARTKDGYTALQLAVKEKADNIARILVASTPSTYTEKFLDVRFAEGETALDAGDLAGAYVIFTKLVEEDPGNQKINFAYGLTCLSLNDYSRAGLAFERVLEINPDNDRAGVELARSYLALGQTEAARKQFEQVLAHNPPRSVRRNIKSYLDEIKKRGKKWNFSGRIDAGYFDDDNVNVGPDSEIISIAPFIFGSQVFTSLSVDEKTQPVTAEGYFSSVGLSGIYDAGEKDKWQITVGGAYYQNRLEDEPQHESLFYQASVGLRRIGRRSMFQLPLRAAHITSGHEPLIDLYGISPTYVYVYGMKGAMHWLTTSTIEFRDFDALDARDGIYVSLGETMKHSFGGGKHNIAMGFLVFYDKTEAGEYEHIGRTWHLSAEIGLLWGSAFYSQVRYTTSDYDEQATLAFEQQSDTRHQVLVGLNWRITPQWGIDINQQLTENNSTFGLYQYDRNITTISTFCTF